MLLKSGDAISWKSVRKVVDVQMDDSNCEVIKVTTSWLANIGTILNGLVSRKVPHQSLGVRGNTTGWPCLATTFKGREGVAEDFLNDELVSVGCP